MIKCKVLSAVKYNNKAEKVSHCFNSESLKTLASDIVNKFGGGDWEKAILEMSNLKMIKYVIQETYPPEDIAPDEREYAYQIFTKIPVSELTGEKTSDYYMCWLELEFNSEEEEEETTNFFYKLCDMQDNGTL